MRDPIQFICGVCGQRYPFSIPFPPCPHCGHVPGDPIPPPPIQHEFQVANGFPNTNDIVKVAGGYGIIKRVLFDRPPTKPNQPTDAVELKCLIYDNTNSTGEIQVSHNVYLRESISLNSIPTETELNILWGHLIDKGMKFDYPLGLMVLQSSREGCNHMFLEIADELPQVGEVISYGGNYTYYIIDSIEKYGNTGYSVIECKMMFNTYVEEAGGFSYQENPPALFTVLNSSDKVSTQKLNDIWEYLATMGYRYNRWSNKFEAI